MTTLVRCRACHEDKPINHYPVVKNNQVYQRCFPCIKKFPVEEIYIRDKATCGICRTHVEFKDASVDHLIPLSKGGRHTPENIWLTHRACNQRKGSAAPWEEPNMFLFRTSPMHVERYHKRNKAAREARRR